MKAKLSNKTIEQDRNHYEGNKFLTPEKPTGPNLTLCKSSMSNCFVILQPFKISLNDIQGRSIRVSTPKQLLNNPLQGGGDLKPSSLLTAMEDQDEDRMEQRIYIHVIPTSFPHTSLNCIFFIPSLILICSFKNFSLSYYSN